MIVRLVFLTLVTAVFTACGHDAGRELQDAQLHLHDENGALVVTTWGRRFEVFAEIDNLAIGESAVSHVHVTVLDGFEPATDGSVTVVLESRNGVQERFGSDITARPGIFNVEIRPGSAGDRDLSFEIVARGVAETVPGGRVRVGAAGIHGDLVEPARVLPEVGGGVEVEFLKEQQWRTSFATAWAEPGALGVSVTGTARVEPPSGGEVILTAPVDGSVRAASWPYTGMPVREGRSVLSLIQTAPSVGSLAELAASVRELEVMATVAAARAERLDSLLAREAVSRREVELAHAEATGLAARLEARSVELAAAEAGRMGHEGVSALEIGAPFPGRVAEVLVSPGQQVAAGAPLARLVRERPVWVRVALTPVDAAKLDGGIEGLVLDAGPDAALLRLSPHEVRLIAIAPEIDQETGSVEVLIEVDRDVDHLKPGLRATVQVVLPEEVGGIVLAESAVVDDAGVPVIYVQLEGETFSRRLVNVLQRQGDLVLVDAIASGERIVTVGGAAIRRATLLASGSVGSHVH